MSSILFGSGSPSSLAAVASSPTSSVEARPLTRKKLRSLSFSLSPRNRSPRSRAASPRRRHKSHPVMGEDQQSPLLHWIESDCPNDVVPHILAFCGPQTMTALSRTSKHWRDVVLNDSTWRIVCEDLYKWSEGDPLPSTSWREFYASNPCVPVDYLTLPSALTAFSVERDRSVEQPKSVRILLRPATYVLREALVIDAVGPSTTITIQTMKLPFRSDHKEIADDPPPTPSLSPTKRLKKKAASLRNMLSCRTMDVNAIVDGMEEEQEMDASVVAGVAVGSVHSSSDADAEATQPPPPSRASIVLRTRRQNEPVIRVRQGSVKMEDLEIVHVSHGMDIWNGNAAVQIQPPTGSDGRPVESFIRPSAHLESVDIVSRSGRGIVNIDGGDLVIRKSYVHDCAATGIYVGGPGTTAEIEETDVIRNGVGNKLSRRGIARGHSGIYLEQGRASIRDCNISLNSLTGISAISDSNAILNLEASDLVANGTQQLELPPDGSVARRMSLTRDNRMATFGLVRTRSGLVAEQQQQD